MTKGSNRLPWCVAAILALALAASAVPRAHGQGGGADSVVALMGPYAERIVIALERMADASERQARETERQRNSIDRIARDGVRCR